MNDIPVQEREALSQQDAARCAALEDPHAAAPPSAARSLPREDPTGTGAGASGGTLDPSTMTIDQLLQYVFLLAVAMLGGVVSWAAKVRAGSLHAFNLSALIGELATSAFAGLLTFWLCSYVAAPQSLTAALVGIAGHMGTRAINQLEQWLQNRITPPHL